MKKILLPALFGVLLLSGCSNYSFRNQAEQFIESYTEQYKLLYTALREAQWKLNTMIIAGDSTNEKVVESANKKYADFTGSQENVEEAKRLLSEKEKLTELQAKQLAKILYLSANNPEIAKEKVNARIKAEAAQIHDLFSYQCRLNGKAVSINDIDELLRVETDLEKRREAWEESKAVGKSLKSGLVNLRNLRNETVKPLGYKDFFAYQVSEYGMSTEELMQLMRKINRELRPLYRELHTFARYELAKKYGVAEVPDYLPAHWLPNRWGQDWQALVTVDGADIDVALRSKSPEWIVKQGEQFFKSLGFPPLPESFWKKSSLYPVPPGAGYQKSNHASSWHIDLDQDVRVLATVVPNAESFETILYELSHIYYFLTYTNKEVPLLLREGATRTYHEAIGSLMGLAALQKPMLEHLQLIPENIKTDDTQALLKEAMSYAIFIPFSAGVMSEFEKSMYADDLPPDQFNKRWWELVKQYQGIVPPSERGEEYCDPSTKTHINDDAAQYYDYALSYILMFQLHDHIANKILNRDPHATNYYGNKEVGDFLREIMYPGSSKDWRKLLKEKTGEDLSAKAMVNYFKPLYTYLKKVNEGRKYTLPETL